MYSYADLHEHRNCSALSYSTRVQIYRTACWILYIFLEISLWQSELEVMNLEYSFLYLDTQIQGKHLGESGCNCRWVLLSVIGCLFLMKSHSTRFLILFWLLCFGSDFWKVLPDRKHVWNITSLLIPVFCMISEVEFSIQLAASRMIPWSCSQLVWFTEALKVLVIIPKTSFRISIPRISQSPNRVWWPLIPLDCSFYYG